MREQKWGIHMIRMIRKRAYCLGLCLLLWVALLTAGELRAGACPYPHTVRVILQHPPEEYVLTLYGDVEDEALDESDRQFVRKWSDRVFQEQKDRAEWAASGLLESGELWSHKGFLQALREDGEQTAEGMLHSFPSVAGDIRNRGRIWVAGREGTVLCSDVFLIEAHEQTVVFDCRQQKIVRSTGDDSGYQSYLRQREQRASDDRLKTLPCSVIVLLVWLAAVVALYFLLGRGERKNLAVLLPDLVLQGGLLIAVAAAFLYQDERLVGTLLLYPFALLGVLRLAAYPAFLRGQHWAKRLLFALLMAVCSYGAAILLFRFGYPPVYD